MSTNERIYLNGIDAVTGKYLVEPLSVEEAAALAQGAPVDKKRESWLLNVWHKIATPFLGLPLGVDPADVTQAGWGIVFAQDEDPAVLKALEPLIEHRRKQINNDALVKVLEYRAGENWQTWLARYAVAPGSVKPNLVPYYLLLVGDPQKMPFSFGQLLDVEYGVGRLHFDSPAEYAHYAASLIAYETDALAPNAKEAVFFSPRHAFDEATKMSADYLVNPLVDGEAGQAGVAQQWNFRCRKIWGAQAEKSALLEVIAPAQGQKTPAFLFTASHGLGFPQGHPSQRTTQGALLCQDWQGFGAVQAGHYFAAADVPQNARVHGMVMFHFACYGAGTPERDQFLLPDGKQPPRIADAPFVAALPRAWLAHPGGGALACIGHVERAWGYSILPPDAGPQILPFQNAIGRILTGQPLGYALKDFNERYAALSTGLTTLLQKKGWGAPVDNNTLAVNWVERNDAEGYILIGDPAAHLRSDVLE